MVEIFYTSLSFGSLILLCIVLFFMKNKFTKGLFWGLFLIFIGLVCNTVFHVWPGWIFIILGIFIAILAIVAWLHEKKNV